MPNTLNYPEIVKDILSEKFTLITHDTTDSELLMIPVSAPKFFVLWNISTKTNGSVKMVSYLAKRIPADKKVQVLELINDLHSRYPFVRLYIDRDNDLTLACDLFIRDGNRESIESCLLHQFSILNTFLQLNYTGIMNCVWSSDESKKDDAICFDEEDNDSDEDGDEWFDLNLVDDEDDDDCFDPDLTDDEDDDDSDEDLFEWFESGLSED